MKNPEFKSFTKVGPSLIFLASWILWKKQMSRNNQQR